MSDLLQFALNTVTNWANDPTNTDFFFPTFLAELDVHGVKYVPFVIRSWDLGSLPEQAQSGGTEICEAWANSVTFPQNCVGFAYAGATLSLSSVSIAGLNNLWIGPAVLTRLANNQVQVDYIADLNTYGCSIAAKRRSTRLFNTLA